MSSREEILNRIRQHQTNISTSLPKVPNFFDKSVDIIDAFKKSLLIMGGTLLPVGDADPLQALKEKIKNANVICSMVPEIKGNRELNEQNLPKELDDIDYAIVRASFGVAETGSICLTEKNLMINTLGYLPQHLIVLLDPAKIVYNLHDAYAQPEWYSVNYASLHSGPSATADIEGVLIRGAQGVRSLSVLLIS
ncbi:MAG: lactate utilization protein [Commensalibacter sp.]|nr:lactate utilization protein [Commensalibacter sp.]